MDKNNGISLFTKYELYSNIALINRNVYGFIDYIINSIALKRNFGLMNILGGHS